MYHSIPSAIIPPPPPRATPGHLTPVRLRIVGHLTRIETRPIGHLTGRKNAGQRSHKLSECFIHSQNLRVYFASNSFLCSKPFNTTIEKRSNKYISDCFWHGGVTYCPSLLIFSGMSKFPQASFSLCSAFEARLVGMSRFHNIVFFIIVLVITRISKLHVHLI